MFVHSSESQVQASTKGGILLGAWSHVIAVSTKSDGMIRRCCLRIICYRMFLLEDDLSVNLWL